MVRILMWHMTQSGQNSWADKTRFATVDLQTTWESVL